MKGSDKDTRIVTPLALIAMSESCSIFLTFFIICAVNLFTTKLP